MASADLSYFQITRLTFEAVLQVVIICVFGFLSAKSGLLSITGQKVISSLNVDIFTPCLVFSKLAPSLSFKKMVDVIVIPIFFVLNTGISFLSSKLMARVLHLNEPEGSFVTAMGVFGNSNSLPVSLTLSLAYTLPNLYWSDIDNDDKDQIASRGILYLLIFQQLGQILRWSWGYNKLLRKRSDEELAASSNHYTKASDSEPEVTIGESSSTTNDNDNDNNNDSNYSTNHDDESTSLLPTRRPSATFDHDVADPHLSPTSSNSETRVQSILSTIRNNRFVKGFFQFMNPPLYAMLVSIIVASIPQLQHMFFKKEDSFVSNTITKAIKQLGLVSIPLILIVLGSNLYPSSDIPPASKNYKKMVFGSLMSRMFLPSLVSLPLIAMCVKFFKISILDDPIFLIVAFILTTSPPAIQLSQITQLNNIYQKEMAGVLFWGYVVFSLPSTIFIVVVSLEVLDWARA